MHVLSSTTGRSEKGVLKNHELEVKITPSSFTLNVITSLEGTNVQG